MWVDRVVLIGSGAYNYAPSLNEAKLSGMVDSVWALVSNDVLVAIPLFIFMGLMLDKSGMAERMMQSMQLLFGRLRGGLALTVVLIGIILAASTGIVGASVVLLGLLAMPAMLQQGYAKSLASGTVCAAGTLGILMPPSIMLVVMADRALTSVGDLFMGAVFPSLILGLSYVAYLVMYGKIWPDRAPLVSVDASAASGASGASAANASETAPQSVGQLMIRVAMDVLPALMLIVSVLGSIVAGVATPTQAAAIGAAAATMLAFAGPKRGGVLITALIGITLLFNLWVSLGRTDEVAVPTAARVSYIIGLVAWLGWVVAWSWSKIRSDWRTIMATGLETARTCGYIFAIFIGAAIFAFVLKRYGGDALIRAGIGDLVEAFGAYQVLAIVLFAIFLLGFVLDWIEITIIILPLIAPAIALMDLGMTGIDQAGLVWFLILMALCLQTSFLTPPVGFSLFFLKGSRLKKSHLKISTEGSFPL